VHDNWFFDNWRYATMLFAVPDFLTSYGGPEGDVFPGVACPGAPQNSLSTSCDNHYFNNKFGQVPDGFRFPKVLDKYGVPHGGVQSRLPNGVDAWWDEFSGNTENCWYSNQGPDGTPSTVTGPGPAGAMAGAPPQTLPDCSAGEDPSSSVGGGDLAKTQYLLACSEGPSDSDTGESPNCDWYSPPAQPNSREAKRRNEGAAAAARAFERSPEARQLQRRIDALVAGKLR
jgi:hypothetical protein